MQKTLTDKELLQFKGLWHGLSMENFLILLSDGVMKARTNHRYWLEGKHYFDDENEYESSFWMKGWSTSRDKFFSMSWGAVVLLLDEDLIKQDFQVKPISWISTLRSAQYIKQEREEFIIAEKGLRTFEELKADFEMICDELEESDSSHELDSFLNNTCNKEGFIGYFKSPARKTIDVNKYVKGFFLRDSSRAPKSEIAEFDHLTKHPLFKGFFSQQRAREIKKKSEPKRISKFS